jgi:hypothetical protein
LTLKLSQARLALLERLLGLVALGFDTGEFLAQVTILIATLPGFVFPLLSTVFDFAKLTHRLHALTSPDGSRPTGGGRIDGDLRR